MANSQKATLFFSVVLLLFVQTLAVWLESIYKIGLTRLSPGMELSGLLFLLSPLSVFLCSESAQRKLLCGSVVGFVMARALLPFVGVVSGVFIGGAGVGAALIALCLLLTRPFRFLQGEAGSALGLALVMSVCLRTWGASYDPSLGRSGALLGWGLGGLVLGLYRHLSVAGEPGPSSEPPCPRGVWSAALGLFASLGVGYLVLSSPGVVEAWLGFDNTPGAMICAAALGGAVILLERRVRLSRATLTVWNVLFGVALVGGVLALRITFPETPGSPAVVVRPDNTVAKLCLNFMFLLSPVVLFNARVMCLSLGGARARSVAMPVLVGIALLVLLAIMSIFTNVWGYVGPLGTPFRNLFHVPFLLASLVMTGTLLLSSSRHGRVKSEPVPAGRGLTGVTLTLVLCALAGSWHHRPGAAKAVPGDSRRLSILSYNMQQGAALDGNRNWENQLALIESVNADLIGLQESDTARPSGGHVCAAKYFGARLGYHIYYGPNTVSGTYGTAILSRYPLKHLRTVFTFSNQDEVGTAVAEFELDGKTFAVFNSHPSGNLPKKCHAEELIRQAAPYEYVIAVGDYNSTPQDAAYRAITAHLKDSWRERHPDGVGPLRPELGSRGESRPQGATGLLPPAGDHPAMHDRIDHIFVSKTLKVIEACYLPAPASQTDHPAHWAIVTWD